MKKILPFYFPVLDLFAAKYSLKIFLQSISTYWKPLLYTLQLQGTTETHLPSKRGGSNIWVFGSWLSKSWCARGACRSWAGFRGTGQWDAFRIWHCHLLFFLVRLVDGDGAGPPGADLARLSQFGGSSTRRLAAHIGVDAAGAGAVPAPARDPTAAGLGWARQTSVLQGCLGAHVQDAIILVLGTI